MTNLIKAEGLKLRKSLGFWVLVLCAFGMSALITVILKAFTHGVLPTGDEIFYQMINQTQMNTILISIFAAVFICGEFINRTFGLSLFSGFLREKIMVAKLVVLFVGGVLLAAIMPVVMLAVFSVIGGFGGNMTLLLRDFGLYSLGNVTMAGFFALLAFTIRNVGGTIGAGIGISMLLGIAASVSIEKFQRVIKFSFVTQQSLVGRDEIHIPFYVGVMLVTLAVEITAAAFILRKSDLK